MTQHHVIIGGGPVATNAAETIRQLESDPSRITLICDEPAHSRMALPYWLSGQIPREHCLTADDAYFQKLRVEPRIGPRATSLDADGRSIGLSDGSMLDFDDLLIATGASPMPLPVPGGDLAGVQTLWTLLDTQTLLDAAQATRRPRVVMIGAGFIGFIMLNAMHKRGWKLSVVEKEPYVLPRMLDRQAASQVESWLAGKGVELFPAATVQSISEAGNGTKKVQLDDGRELAADVIISAIGIRPNRELARGTGIDTDEGLLVNDRMQTSVAHIYAGGDVAQGPVLFDDKPAIHAIQTTAVDHGRIAGANMAGHDVRYPGSLLMNILDACGLQCASFGNWADTSGDVTTIANAGGYVYRKLIWTDDEITGAIFLGRANDLGMLTDVGMVKGFMQTRTRLGRWKAFLTENPFDIRRPYIAQNVAAKLAGTTLIGRPAEPRQYRFQGRPPTTTLGSAHAAYVKTRPSS